MYFLKALGPHERGHILDHLLRLSPQDRYDRFMVASPDTRLAAYVQGIDFVGERVLGVWRGARLVGMAHIAPYRTPAGEAVAEVGLTVEPPFRRQGLGRRLLARAIESAADLGLQRLLVLLRVSNVAMAATARSLGARLDSEADTAQAWFDVAAAPSPAGAAPASSRHGSVPGSRWV